MQGRQGLLQGMPVPAAHAAGFHNPLIALSACAPAPVANDRDDDVDSRHHSVGSGYALQHGLVGRVGSWVWPQGGLQGGEAAQPWSGGGGREGVLEPAPLVHPAGACNCCATPHSAWGLRCAAACAQASAHLDLRDDQVGEAKHRCRGRGWQEQSKPFQRQRGRGAGCTPAGPHMHRQQCMRPASQIPIALKPFMTRATGDPGML